MALGFSAIKFQFPQTHRRIFDLSKNTPIMQYDCNTNRLRYRDRELIVYVS